MEANQQLPIPLVIKCDDCGEVIGENESTNRATNENGSAVVCNSCLEYDYAPCYNCDEWYSNSTLTASPYDDRRLYCDDCFHNKFQACADCGEYFSSEGEGAYVADLGAVCDRCLDGYTCCSQCNDYVSRDSSMYCDDCGEDFCSACYHDSGHDCAEAARGGEVEPGSIVIGSKKGKYIKDSRLVGVEIETEGISGSTFQSRELPDGVGAVRDGSLHNGIELVTPPASLDKLESIITDTCKYARSSGLKIEDTCGLHIHLDMREYRDNPEVLAKVMQTYYTVERVLFALVPHDRRGSSYCRSLRSTFSSDEFMPDKAKDVDKIYYKMHNMQKSNKYCNARYYWCNLHSVYYRGTLEIRLHSGTINEHKILSWVALHQAIVAYALSTRFKIEKLEAIMSSSSGNSEILEKLGRLIKLPAPIVKYYQMRLSKFN